VNHLADFTPNHSPPALTAEGRPQPPSGERRWVRASTPEDGPAIVALMRDAGLEPHDDPAHLQWKYWQERPDWPGSRSYVFTDGLQILAHGAVIPGACQWKGGRGRVIHMIDWAARRSEVGVGVALMKHIGRLSDFLLGIGGSAHTLQIMPRIGYQACGTVAGYSRPLSPVALLSSPGRPHWKRIPRFARSALWSLMAPSGGEEDWITRRIEANETREIAGALPTERADAVVFERTEILFRHLLACPMAPMELFAMDRGGSIAGYFLISYVPGQARLADCWMNSSDLRDWCALVQSAVRQAVRRQGAAELVTWSSDPMLSAALQSCGFHVRLTLPIYVRSSGSLQVPTQTMRVQMVDNDACYNYFRDDELWA
jgi:hypothetical protein